MGQYVKKTFPKFLYYVDHSGYLFGPFFKKPNVGHPIIKFALTEVKEEEEKT